MSTRRPRSAANNSSFRCSRRWRTGFLWVRRRRAWCTASRGMHRKAMSETNTQLVLPREADTGVVQAGVSIGQIFLEFLIIGATSFGGVVRYLRGSLGIKRQGMAVKEF